jgi:hypothetical protein
MEPSPLGWGFNFYSLLLSDYNFASVTCTVCLNTTYLKLQCLPAVVVIASECCVETSGDSGSSESSILARLSLDVSSTCRDAIVEKTGNVEMGRGCGVLDIAQRRR